MTQIAFLGTGLLGSAFVEAAAGRGESIAVWNRTAAKAQALQSFGVRVAATPADAVSGASFVHLVLKDDAVVDEVIAALRPGLESDAVILDHSTTQPALTAERSRRLNDDGVRYLHCPVFVGPAAARQGKGTMLAAGPKSIFDAVCDHLSRMVARVEYFGERPDLAAVYKLCGNAFMIGVNAVVADVLAVATASDVDPVEAMKVVAFFDPHAMINGGSRKMMKGHFAPSFELTMARKDVRLMMETAGDRPLAALPGIAARMDRLIADGYGDDDMSVIGRGSVL